MNTEDEIRRGHEAKRILESEIYKEAMSTVEAGIMKAWANSPLRDIEGQHELRLMLKLLADINRHITDVATTGKLATIQVDTIKRKFQRAMGG